MYPKRFDRLAIKTGKLQIVAKQCEIIGSKTCQLQSYMVCYSKKRQHGGLQAML